jgi:hypothetical protein
MIPLGVLAAQAPGEVAAYELIATQTLTAAVSSITFSTIPQDYKHLQLRIILRGSAATSFGWQWLQISLNGTNLNRYHEVRAMDGSFSAANGPNSFTFPITGNNQGANIFGSGIIDITDYSSTSKNTTIRSIGGQTDATRRVIVLSGGLQTSTSAVTSIGFTPQNGGNFIANSRISLYGIKG